MRYAKNIVRFEESLGCPDVLTDSKVRESCWESFQGYKRLCSPKEAAKELEEKWNFESGRDSSE